MAVREVQCSPPVRLLGEEDCGFSEDLLPQLELGDPPPQALIGDPSAARSCTTFPQLSWFSRSRPLLSPEASWTLGPVGFGPSGMPIRWVIDLEQVQDLSSFMVPGPIAETFLVHPEVKDALVAAGFTGMDVRRTRT